MTRTRGSDLAGAGALGALVLVVSFFPNPTLLSISVFALIYAIAAIGLSLLMGLAGQINLGQAGFFAIGAYTDAIMLTRYQAPIWLAALVAVAVTGAAALLLGLPLLRLRGHYLALATLGFGMVVMVVANEWSFTGGTSGIFGIFKPAFGGRVYDSTTEYIWLLAPVTLVGVLLASNLTRSRTGRALQAANDSEIAAESLGVNTYRLRLGILVLSAMYAAVGGCFYAQWLGVVNPNSSSFSLSIMLLLMAILGGMGSVWGAVIGAFLVQGLDTGLRWLIPILLPNATGEVQLLGFGLVLVLVVIFAPNGLTGLWQSLVGRRSGSRVAVPVSLAPAVALPGLPECVPSAIAGKRLLHTNGLTKNFGGVIAVDDVALEVVSGEILAVIGPNGAGKSTFFNMVTGALQSSSGHVILGGKEVQNCKPHVIAAGGATRTFQNLEIFESMSVVENVKIGAHLWTREGMLRGAFRFAPGREQAQVTQYSHAVLQLVGLDEHNDRPAADLPFGQQRLVEIARALIRGPQLLLLDEPMAGLSRKERLGVARLLGELRDHGLGVVFVEHDMEFVLSLADRIAVFNDGRLIALGSPDEIRQNPEVIAAYLGTEEVEDDLPLPVKQVHRS